MAKFNEAPLPKPYDFVAIEPLGRNDRQRPRGHDRYQAGMLVGELRGKLVVQTPLHVWSGQIGMTGQAATPLVKSHFRVNERPAVPGSTLKGTVRSIVEAITRSCVRVTRARPNQLPTGAAACRNAEQLCLACRLFGAMDFQGLVRFGDAVLQKEKTLEIVRIPPLYSPRSREKLYYIRDQVVGRKFFMHGRPVSGDTPLEACPVGSELDFTLSFTNLSAAELGVLLIALGQGDGQAAPRLWPKLGGGKPVCYGTVTMNITELQVETAGAAVYASYDPTPPVANTDWGEYLRAASTLVVPAQMRKMAEILQWPTERSCPDRNY